MALAYLRELSRALDVAYTGDCTHYAEEMARRLLEDGCSPWIGAIRDVVTLPDGRVYHAPLTLLKYAGSGGPTWNVHYVCCRGDEAFEPILGEPFAVDDLGERLFGRKLAVAKVIDEGDTERVLRTGTFREHLKTLRRR
jgi:hypothetical protein